MIFFLLFLYNLVACMSSYLRAPFLVAQTVKNLSAMQDTQVQSLGWEGPLEKGMTTNSSVLAWRIPRREEPGGLWSMGSQSQALLSD